MEFLVEFEIDVPPGETATVLGLYVADGDAQLADLALQPHPNEPAIARS
jgi:hypothetical protein